MVFLLDSFYDEAAEELVKQSQKNSQGKYCDKVNCKIVVACLVERH